MMKYDITQFLEFHYTAYPHKSDFLRFVTSETAQRLKRRPINAFENKT